MTSALNAPDAELREWLSQSPYASYAYSYPHKMAYRPLDPPVSLREAWAGEQRDALFLYMHVPFCEMRCGFCNLFTTTGRNDVWGTDYLNALERHARRARAALGAASFERLAIGGGTPTILPPDELHRLFDIAENVLGADPHRIPVSVETSPQTATPERLSVLRERGVTRVSIGVQSFIEAEVHAVGRAQETEVVETALERIRAAGFPILNIDLMYGLPGQTLESWLASLTAALRYSPEEIYLYPLYVRPLTGVGRKGIPLPLQSHEDIRLECYRAARDTLLSAGYRQVSMRMFQATRVTQPDGPVYCCQEDGMVGIGCGARSYTSALHYSTEYAVGAPGVRDIISSYLARPEESFDWADYGFALDGGEQRRRYLIQSLLQVEGLSLCSYMARFGTCALEDVPQLQQLEQHGLAEKFNDRLQLTPHGIEYSDVIGPWLGSAEVRQRIGAFDLR